MHDGNDRRDFLKKSLFLAASAGLLTTRSISSRNRVSSTAAIGGEIVDAYERTQ